MIAHRQHAARRPARMGVLVALLLAVWGMAEIGYAQTYNFHHYDTDDGLPQVQVLSVYRDDTGYLWVGSYGGLSRYNGQVFENYTTEDGLGANVVEAIVMDASGRLWAGTGAGLCSLEQEWSRFECLESGQLADAYVYGLHAEAEALWAATDVGLFRIHERDVRHYGRSSGLPVPDVRSIERDGEGVLWAGTTDGLARMNSETGEFIPVRVPEDAGRRVSTFLFHDGVLWIGTEQGLYRYQDGEVAEAPGIPPTVSDTDIADMVVDREGKLWVATNLGVLWLKDGEFELLTRRNGLRYIINFSLFAGREGLVWVGHDQGLSK